VAEDSKDGGKNRKAGLSKASFLANKTDSSKQGQTKEEQGEYS